MKAEAESLRILSHDERAELERLRAAFAASRDIAYEWDLETGVMIWSAGAAEMLGLADIRDIATRARFIARVNGEDLDVLARVQDQLIAGRPGSAVEYRLRTGDGRFCWVEDRAVARLGADGRAITVFGTLRIITPRKQREARLEWLTRYDELTGHYNRSRLREALDHAIAYAERYDAPGAYLTVAIDDLSLIGDAYGTEIADAAVIAVGQALDQCLRASDVVGRVAEDQFGVIVSACAETDMASAADKILSELRQVSVRAPAGPLHITASIGGVPFPSIARTAQDAMIKAEIALAGARRSGHNRFVAYDLTEAQLRDRRRDLAVARRVQAAMQTDRLAFAFQPVVSSVTGEACFYECLLRMREDDGATVPAGAFLRVAEETGLVRLLDRRAIEMAADELAADDNVVLAINVSGLTTTDPGWMRCLHARLKGRRNLARRLIIEITETAALHDIEETTRFVTAVHDAGCRVALDDFGAGYTSFRHLKALAVDVVKIDGSFVTNLAKQPEDFLFVKTLRDLAAGFGIETVAECVETREVAEMLVREGVDYLQGYYFGRPDFARPWRGEGAPPQASLRAAG